MHHQNYYYFSADGYNRSEGSVAFFLQRKEDALRSYGTPIVDNAIFIGSKNISFSQVSKDSIKTCLENYYRSKHIDPLLIAYVEAAGVASKVIYYTRAATSIFQQGWWGTGPTRPFPLHPVPHIIYFSWVYCISSSFSLSLTCM